MVRSVRGAAQVSWVGSSSLVIHMQLTTEDAKDVLKDREENTVFGVRWVCSAGPQRGLRGVKAGGCVESLGVDQPDTPCIKNIFLHRLGCVVSGVNALNKVHNI